MGYTKQSKDRSVKLKKAAVGTSIIVGTYLLATAPRFGKKKDISSNCKTYAHRGLFGKDIPENSLAAFAAAADKGFGIELDVRQSADGTLYVFHDDNVQRMCGLDKNFKDLHDSEVNELRLNGTEHRIPYFDEVLSMIDGRVPLLIELKAEMGNKTLSPAVAEYLDSYDGDYYVESFNSFLMSWYKKNRPKTVRGQLYTDCFKINRKLGLFADSMLINSISRPDFIAYDIKYSKKPILRLCLGLFKPRRFVWTVKDSKTFERFYNDGITDGIIFEGFIPEIEEANER